MRATTTRAIMNFIRRMSNDERPEDEVSNNPVDDNEYANMLADSSDYSSYADSSSSLSSSLSSPFSSLPTTHTLGSDLRAQLRFRIQETQEFAVVL